MLLLSSTGMAFRIRQRPVATILLLRPWEQNDGRKWSTGLTRLLRTLENSEPTQPGQRRAWGARLHAGAKSGQTHRLGTDRRCVWSDCDGRCWLGSLV